MCNFEWWKSHYRGPDYREDENDSTDPILDGSHPCCTDNPPQTGCDNIECDCMVDECDNGDIACDSYNNIERDIRLLVNMKVKVFKTPMRFNDFACSKFTDFFRIIDFLYLGVVWCQTVKPRIRIQKAEIITIRWLYLCTKWNWNFYQLIDKLLENGIEPIVTLYHWDLPSALHTKGFQIHKSEFERERFDIRWLTLIRFQ